MDKKKKRQRRKLRKAIDQFYADSDRQEELIDIICQCFLNDQGRSDSDPKSE